MARVLLIVSTVVACAVAAFTATAGADAFPPRIDLPNGFQPEGIATAGDRFFAGSIPTGAIYSGKLSSGDGTVLVPPHAGRASLGIDEDRGLLFVAGGPTGMGFVYNARTGADVDAFTFATGGGTFVNDVAVTRTDAWFTDSMRQMLYRVPLAPGGAPASPGGFETLPLTGDIVFQPGFNTNGIDATPNGKTLVIVQTNTGTLFTVDPGSGSTHTIDLGGESVPNGDGILLDGHRLYVVQNQLNLVAKIALSSDLQSGTVLDRFGDPGLAVPTTIDEHGSHLYALNARFGTPPTPNTEYWITRLSK